MILNSARLAMKTTKEAPDAIEARRRKALIKFGIDPTDWPLSVLRDEPSDIEPEPINHQSVDVVPQLSDAAWNMIADVFPQPHANQKLSWRETCDALIMLTQRRMAWVRLGSHSEAIRARLNRSRIEQWIEIEHRMREAEVEVGEHEHIVLLCKFAMRYLTERDARTNAAPTPTAVQRLLRQ
jgi:hypothetical protein